MLEDQKRTVKDWKKQKELHPKKEQKARAEAQERKRWRKLEQRNKYIETTRKIFVTFERETRQ